MPGGIDLAWNFVVLPACIVLLVLAWRLDRNRSRAGHWISIQLPVRPTHFEHGEKMPRTSSEAAVWGNASAGVSSTKVFTGSNRVEICVHTEDGKACARCALEQLEQQNYAFQAVGLADADIERCVRRLTPPQRDLLILQPEAIMIAGGFIRSVIAGERIKDIDYFVPSKDAAGLGRDAYVRWEDGKVSIQPSPLAITLSPRDGSPPIQIIHRYAFKDPSDVLKDFDLTVSQAAIWFGKDFRWRGMCASSYYEDLAAKRLVICDNERTDMAPGLLLRILKHVELGYTLSKSQCARAVAIMVKCAARTAQGPADLTNLEATQERLYKTLSEGSTSPEFQTLCQVSVSHRSVKLDRHDWGS